MRIAIGADHAGIHLKNDVGEHLRTLGHEVVDLGTHDEQSVDYPDFARAVAGKVAGGDCALGIAVCGTGIGVSITANKVPGIRAAACSDTFSARMAREHNDANLLCFGARVVGSGLALELVDTFLGATFGGGRHQRRVDKINALDGARQPA